ncbi:hypothetical protein [Pleomorphomonas sp. PLEO]|uniref:hypothetical protein n=1 Tax=Pleomorphomonas sp. PLEO TaxID=3239306 RepID=UPI00351E4890
MILFLAGVLEQMDLALEHLSKNEVHNARFALMLTDNATELILHQFAKDQAGRLKSFRHVERDYTRKEELTAALGKSFDSKVRFARIEGFLSDEFARTINFLHTYRNDLYHVGLQHEPILQGLAELYFDTSCRFLAGFTPGGLYWGSAQKLPERAKKYFTRGPDMPATFGDFEKGCGALAAELDFNPKQMVHVLADHMDRVIDYQDTCLGVVANGVYVGAQVSRDQAVIDTQAWTIAFTDVGKTFAQDNGWSGGTVWGYIEWLKANYPFRIKVDPIPSWRKQVARLRAKANPHVALANYQSFMDVTAELRDAIESSAASAEAEIDRLIDERRGK